MNNSDMTRTEYITVMAKKFVSEFSGDVTHSDVLNYIMTYGDTWPMTVLELMTLLKDTITEIEALGIKVAIDPKFGE